MGGQGGGKDWWRGILCGCREGVNKCSYLLNKHGVYNVNIF